MGHTKNNIIKDYEQICIKIVYQLFWVRSQSKNILFCLTKTYLFLTEDS